MQMKNSVGKLHCSAFTFIHLRGPLACCDFISIRPDLLKICAFIGYFILSLTFQGSHSKERRDPY